MTETLTRMIFNIPDISCGHCEMTIREEVGALSGVKLVEASNQSKTANVEFDPSVVTIDTIRATLVEAGYPPQN